MKADSPTDRTPAAGRITMPHMGLFSKIFFRFLFESFGLDVILTTHIDDDTIREGVHLSGEQFCMPLKITMGDIKRGVELGASGVIYTANCGPCRYGRYWDVIQQRLEGHFGRKIPFYLIEHGNEVPSTFEIVRSLGVEVEWEEYIEIMRIAACKLDYLIQIEDRMAVVMACAIDPYRVRAAFDRCLPALESASTESEMEAAQRRVLADFNAIEQRPEPAARILIIGEIYEMVEPTANLNIVDKLGHLGVAGKKAISYNEQVSFRKAHRFASRWRIFDDPQQAEDVRRDFIDCFNRYEFFGGYGQNSICFARIAKKMGYDGLIHVYPFTCMPEIIAKPFIERFCADDDLPVLFVTIDEHFCEEGFNTRLEAFVDVVTGRKQQRTT